MDSTYRSAQHVLSQLGEKWLGHQILVVLVQKFLSGLLGLKSNEAEPSLFESTQDVSNEAALDTIGLDLYVGQHFEEKSKRSVRGERERKDEDATIADEMHRTASRLHAP